MSCPGPVFSRILENALSDKLNASHNLGAHNKDNKRMATSRCAHLIAIATVNKLDEVIEAIIYIKDNNLNLL